MPPTAPETPPPPPHLLPALLPPAPLLPALGPATLPLADPNPLSLTTGWSRRITLLGTGEAEGQKEMMQRYVAVKGASSTGAWETVVSA